MKWLAFLLTMVCYLALLVWQLCARIRERITKKPTKPSTPARDPLDFPHVAPPMLHLLDKASERPICGASIREPWTVIPETATCPECRREGDAAMVQWWTNNR